jgi:excisionase family DNA binding protein
MDVATRIPSERMGMSVAECCYIGGVGKSFLYEEIGRGNLPARKIGRRTIVLRDDFMRWVESCPLISPKKGDAHAE